MDSLPGAVERAHGPRPRTARRLVICLVPGGRRRTGTGPVLLGRASVQTTERYLGTNQDLVHAPNDGIKLRDAA
jgi:hypothetical protein